MLEFDWKYSEFKPQDAGELADDLKTLQEDLFLQKVFYDREIIPNPSQYPKLENAKTQALNHCISELQNADEEKANRLARVIKEIYSYERYCLHSKMTVPTQVPSLDLFYNTQNATAVSAFFHHLSSGLFTFKDLTPLLTFALSYVKPYELVLMSFKNNFAEIGAALHKWYQKDANQAQSLAFSDVLKQFEDIFSENKFCISFSETWKSAAHGIINNIMGEQQFAKQVQYFKREGIALKDLAMDIGGLAFFTDLGLIFQGKDQVAAANFLRKLLAIHGFLVKLRVVIAKIPKEGVDAHKETLNTLPIWLDNSVVDVVRDLVGKIEGTTSVEAELLEDCCLLIGEFVMLGCKEVLCSTQINSTYCIPMDVLTSHFNEFLKALTAPTKQEDSGSSVFQFTLEALVQHLSKGSFANQKDRKAALSRALHYLLRSLKALIRRDVLAYPGKGIMANQGFLLNITHFAIETIVRLPFLDTCLNNFEIIYLIYIAVQGTKYSYCLTNYDFIKIYEVFTLMILELQDSNLKWLHEPPLSFQYNREGIKLIWGYYFFAKLVYLCRTNNLNQKSAKLGEMISDISIFAALFNSKVYAYSELAYTAIKFLIWLWFENVKILSIGKSNYLEVKQHDSLFGYVLTVFEDFFQKRWENYWILPSVLQLKSSEHLTKKCLLDKKMLYSIVASLFSGVSMTRFKGDISETIRLLESKLIDAHYDNLKQLALSEAVIKEERNLIELTQKLYAEISKKSQLVSKDYKSQRELYYQSQRLCNLEFYYSALSRLQTKCQISSDVKCDKTIEWMSQPWIILYPKCAYLGGYSDINLNLTKFGSNTSIIEKHIANWVRVSSETVKIKIEEADILSGENLLKLLDHYKAQKNLRSTYFDGIFTIPSLRYCHYLQFIINHSFPKNSNEYFEDTKIKLKAQIFKEEIERQGFTIKEFLRAVLRTFLQVAENYMMALLKRKNAESDPQRVFQDLLASYSYSDFFKEYSVQTWRILQLVYSDSTKKEFEVWDDFPLLEELEKITLEDLSDQLLLAKKAFRNLVLMRMISSGIGTFSWYSTPIDKAVFIISMMQRAESLASVFNWQIALSSEIELFQAISKEDKKGFLESVKMRLEKMQVKAVILDILKLKEENEDSLSRYKMCTDAFDNFMKKIATHACQSLLLFSDVEPVGFIFLEMLKVLFKDVNRTTDDFQISSQRRLQLVSMILQLHSSYYQFRKNKDINQYYRDHDLSSYQRAIQETLESSPENVKEDVSNKVELVSGCCRYVQSNDPELFGLLKFSLELNFLIRSTIFKQNSTVENRIVIFQKIIKHISSHINLEGLAEVQKKQAFAQDQTIAKIYGYYFRLTRLLPITTCQYLIPLYLETQQKKNKTQIWELLHQAAMLSYRLWKFSTAADSIIDSSDGYASRLFGTLSFLTETHSENFSEGHYLDEKELRELLMIPNRSYDNALELEALFLAQALSGYTDESTFMEIKLNQRIHSYHPAPYELYKEALITLVNPEDPISVSWMTEFFYSKFEFETSKAGGELVIKGKIPKSEPWMLKHSVKKPTPVFNHLKGAVGSSVEDVIEKVFESHHKAISILHQDPRSNQKMLLSWCLVHLINLVDNFSHLIPYIVSKKFRLKGGQGESESEEATFIDLLMQSFIHQPYLTENLVTALLQKSKDYIVGPGTTDSSFVDLSAVLGFQILESIIQAVKSNYQKFVRNPSYYLILVINNYFTFLDPLQKDVESTIKTLPKEEKRKFLKLLESLANEMYSLYCDLAQRNDHLDHNVLRISPCLEFISNIYNYCTGYTIQQQKAWNESNLYCILGQLESLQAQAQAQTKSTNSTIRNPLNLKIYSEVPEDSSSKVTHKFSSYSTGKNYAGVSRESNATYYRSVPESVIPLLEKDDAELCNQARVHSVQKKALNFKNDCLAAFIWSYAEAMDSSIATLIEKKVVKAPVTQKGDLSQLRKDLEREMLAKITAGVEKAQTIPAQQTFFSGFRNKMNVQEEHKKQHEKPQQILERNDQIANEEIKLNEIKEVKANQIPNTASTAKKKKEIDTSSVDLDVGLLTEGLLEALFEFEKEVVLAYLEEMLKQQKQFMEAIFIEELPYCLPNAAIDLFDILEVRGKTLKRFLMRLDLYSMKFFWLFLPESFKNLVKHSTQDDVDYYSLCKDTISERINNPDLQKYINSSLFEVLNESLKRYENPTNTGAKQDKSANKPVDNVIVEASIYTEADEEEHFERAKSFNQSADNVERAISAISWLYLLDSHIETLVLKIAKSKNMDTVSLYGHMLVNPLNELRLFGSLLALLEDVSLEKMKALLSKHGQQIKLNYPSVVSNILFTVNRIYTYQPEPIAALKVAASFINKFIISSLNVDYPKELEHLSGLERILQLIDNKTLLENETFLESIMEFASNYLKDNKFYIVKSPSTFPYGQFSHKMISIELAEKIWVFMMDLWKRGHIISRSDKFQPLVSTLMKNYTFFHFVQPSIIQTYIPVFKTAKDKVASAISKLADSKKFVDELQAVYREEFAIELKNLEYLVDLMNQCVLIQFSGIAGRMEYNQRNVQSKGALGRWATALHIFVVELAQCEDVKELILSMLEIVYLESASHDSQKNKNYFKITEPSVALFKVLVEFKAALVISTEIAAPSKKLLDFETGQFGEVGMMKQYSSLQRYVSSDMKEVPEVLPITMSFHQMKSAGRNIELEGIYLHSIMRISKKMLGELLRRFSGSDIAKRLFSMKFSFFQDLSQKEAGSIIRVPPSAERCITIDRKTHLLDSIRMWTVLPRADRSKYRPKISYKNEPGVDGGGLLRSWFVENTKHLFDPAFGLFKVAENARVIHPNIASKIIPEHLSYFEYAGYHVAMAIRTKSIIDVHFTKSFYKMILDRPLTLSDLEELDSALYKNLQWMLDNDVNDLFQTFSYETDLFGERFLVELDEKGADIFVTNENKELYVKLFAMAKMQKETALEINAFLQGFNDILPTSALQKFTPGELEAIIAGASTIDIEDMKAHTSCNGYSDQFKKWFWEIMEEFNQSQRSAFLYFITGSTKVPYGGFKEQPITLNRQSASLKLPIAHTCSRSIDLPEYGSKQILKEKLLKGIYEGTDSFMIS